MCECVWWCACERSDNFPGCTEASSRINALRNHPGTIQEPLRCTANSVFLFVHALFDCALWNHLGAILESRRRTVSNDVFAHAWSEPVGGTIQGPSKSHVAAQQAIHFCTCACFLRNHPGATQEQRRRATRQMLFLHSVWCPHRGLIQNVNDQMVWWPRASASDA